MLEIVANLTMIIDKLEKKTSINFSAHTYSHSLIISVMSRIDVIIFFKKSRLI